MEKQANKYIQLAYELYDVTENEPNLIEKTQEDRPFAFISGMGIALDKLEDVVTGLAQGETFDFTLTPAEAYGDYQEGRVVDLDRSLFEVDGKFDSEHVYVDGVIPLQNADGNRFLGRVVSIDSEKVKVDLNHPLAGKMLNFKGTVLVSRDATNEEIKRMAELLAGNDADDGEGHHCHHGEGCCGHHHCDHHHE